MAAPLVPAVNRNIYSVFLNDCDDEYVAFALLNMKVLIELLKIKAFKLNLTED